MLETGRYAFYALPFFAICACAASLAGTRSRRAHWARSGERAVYAAFVLASLAVVGIENAMLNDRFDVGLVAQASSREQATFFKLAFWVQRSGALLLWVWILALAAALRTWLNRKQRSELEPWVIVFLSANLTFYTLLTWIFADPFSPLSAELSNGHGMPAPLQYPMVFLHPPILYLGFASFSVPFALALAALTSGRIEGTWLESARRWSVVAWLMLGLGILSGSYWAYEKVGWGGYWSWDPTQCAALVPWLSSTALLHSVALQERRGILKLWNIVLLGLTYVLCVFTSFLVHSGVLQSIHSYSGSTDGLSATLGAYLVVLILAFASLTVLRAPQIERQGHLESLVSLDAGVLVSQYLLFSGISLLLLGMLWPVLSEIGADTRVQVGPLFFERYGRWLGVLALVLILGTSLIETKTPRRAAAHVAHLALFVMALGFFGATLDTSGDALLAPGESWTFGRYTVEYRSVHPVQEGGFVGGRARLGLRIDGRPAAILSPEKRSYLQQGLTWTRPAIYSTWREDFHVILVGIEPDQSVAVEAVIKPFVQWVWVGGWLLLVGGTLLLAPSRTAGSSTRSRLVSARTHLGAQLE